MPPKRKFMYLVKALMLQESTVISCNGKTKGPLMTDIRFTIQKVAEIENESKSLVSSQVPIFAVSLSIGKSSLMVSEWFAQK